MGTFYCQNKMIRMKYVFLIFLYINICIMSNAQVYSYKYPRPAVTADCVVVTRTGKVLLIQRGFQPYKGSWAFPGGFMNMDETTDECAKRELLEETGLTVDSLKLVGVYSKVDRDPRSRVITTAYITIIDDVKDVKGSDDATNAQWFSVEALPPLAFDHDEIMKDALEIYRQMR